jgi:hypothetical protein
MLYAKLKPGDDLAKVKFREISPLRCPHFIFIGEHYREDGSCKCDDPDERVMREWGYRWNKKLKRWM